MPPLPARILVTGANGNLGRQLIGRLCDSADEDGGNKGSKIEMSSPEELEKFSKLGPIDSKEIRSCNLDELCRQLLGF